MIHDSTGCHPSKTVDTRKFTKDRVECDSSSVVNGMVGVHPTLRAQECTTAFEILGSFLWVGSRITQAENMPKPRRTVKLRRRFSHRRESNHPTSSNDYHMNPSPIKSKITRPHQHDSCVYNT